MVGIGVPLGTDVRIDDPIGMDLYVPERPGRADAARRRSQQTLGGAGMVWLVIVAALGLGAGLALWLRRRR